MAETAAMDVLNLPQGEGFRCIDKQLSLAAGKVVTSKTFLGIEVLDLADHFPGQPIYPGVVILEGMNQTLELLGAEMLELAGKTPVVAGYNKVRFRRPVKPGDTIIFEGEITKIHLPVGFGEVTAKVGTTIVATAEIIFSFLNKEK